MCMRRWLAVDVKYKCNLCSHPSPFGIPQNKVWLFMELMDSCIDSILRKTGPIPEPIIGTILVSVSSWLMLV